MIRANKSDLAKAKRTIKSIERSTDAFSAIFKEESIETVVKMKRDAPAVSGKLRESIELDSNGRTFEIESMAPYSLFVEFGTRYQKAQPFFFHNAKAFSKNVAAKARKIIKRIMNKRS